MKIPYTAPSQSRLSRGSGRCSVTGPSRDRQGAVLQIQTPEEELQ